MLHIGVDVAGSGMRYNPGDSLGVVVQVRGTLYPANKALFNGCGDYIETPAICKIAMLFIGWAVN